MSALNASSSAVMFCVSSAGGFGIHASSSSSSANAPPSCGSHAESSVSQPILFSIASSLPTVRSVQDVSTRFSVSASSWTSSSSSNRIKRRLQAQAQKDVASSIRTVPVQVAHELINTGHHYLDVRTPEEFAAGHVEGSINIPYMVKMGPGMIKNVKFVEEVSQEFDKDDEIIVACQSGRRSLMAVAELRAVNFSAVTDMGGGYSAWKESGLPLQTQRSQQARQGALADAQMSEADSQEKLKARIQELKSASTIDEVESRVREGQVSDNETSREEALGQEESSSSSGGEAKTEVLNVEQAEIDNESARDVEGQDGEISSDFDDMEDVEVEKGYKMSRVCDRLIEVFMVEKTKPEEWRILLAFSQEWVKIRPYFFKRCKALANVEEDLKRKADLLKLARRMKKVDNDIQRHDQLLAVIEENPSEMDRIVAHRRQDFTGDFFKHLNILCDACYEDPTRRDELASLAAQCLASVQAYDTAVADDEKLSAAQLKFDDVLNSPSLEAAAKKIDNLAKNWQLDSTLMLLITKAWAAAKESTIMKEEVKDIMFHLYNVARGNMSRLVPKEVRIIRHLLSIEDPRERVSEMTNAFSPGDELEGKDVDNLYTTPDKLHKWLTIVLDAFYSNKKGTLIKEAQNLMNPSIIGRIEALKGVLEDHFM